MRTIQEIESAIAHLSPVEQRAIRDWLDELIEEQMVVSQSFQGKIARAKDQLAAGEGLRLRTPGATTQ
jgi:hypothetical protein